MTTLGNEQFYECRLVGHDIDHAICWVRITRDAEIKIRIRESAVAGLRLLMGASFLWSPVHGAFKLDPDVELEKQIEALEAKIEQQNQE